MGNCLSNDLASVKTLSYCCRITTCSWGSVGPLPCPSRRETSPPRNVASQLGQQLQSFSLPPLTKFFLWLTLQGDVFFRGGRAASERLSAARIGERPLLVLVANWWGPLSLPSHSFVVVGNDGDCEESEPPVSLGGPHLPKQPPIVWTTLLGRMGNLFEQAIIPMMETPIRFVNWWMRPINLLSNRFNSPKLVLIQCWHP